MNIDQERADFEAWFSKTKAYISNHKGIFAQIAKDIAWDTWKARAALQSQDREDALLFRKIMNMTRAEREEEPRIIGHDDRGEPCYALTRRERVFFYVVAAIGCGPWIVGGYFLWKGLG